MPEGHTIHRLARDLNRTLRPGPVTASSPQGRFAAGAELLDGRELDQATAWGKHLFLDFDGTPPVHIHLGLIGKFRRKNLEAPIRGAIRLRLEGPERLWDLTGPMVCDVVDDDDVAAITSQLGPDPLRPDADPAEFVRRLARRRVAVAAALLDQKVVAGIGNVYRSEFCFLLGLRPDLPANQVSKDTAEQLWELAVDQLKQGVRLNRITTRDPAEVGVAAGRISGDDRLYVYKRDGKPCHRCGESIRLVDIGQRKAWYCPSCQT